MIDNFVTVTTFLWRDPARVRGYKCEPQHVVTLRNMVQRHLTVPHEFVCVTNRRDWADTLEAHGIRTAPLDVTKHVPGTCFVRLMLRHPHIAALLGKRIFNLDLDVVITGNIDELLLHPAKNVWWKNPNYPAPKRSYFQTSVQLLTAGTLTELWRDFDPKETPKWVNRRFGGAEQAWVAERLNWEDQAIWTEEDGIYGSMRLGGKGVGSELPENARIVSFPGDRSPWQEEMRQAHPWLASHYR
jgi:hypothetical protein